MTSWTIYSSTADTYTESANATYATARSGSNLFVPLASATDVKCGQVFSSPDYIVWESVFIFDTSAVPTGVDSSVALTMQLLSNFASTGFDLEARDKVYIGPTVATTDYVPGASLSALASFGSYTCSNTSTPATSTDFSITSSITAVPRSNRYPLHLSSSRTRANNTPTGNEYVRIYTADQTGTTQDPRLTFDSTPDALGIYAITNYVSSTSDAASWSPLSGITCPAGGMLVFIASADGNPTLTTSSSAGGINWLKPLTQASNSTIVTGVPFTFTNNTVSDITGIGLTISSTASEQFSGVLLVCTTAAAIGGTSANGSSANSDPPSHNNGSAQDAIWIATRSGDAQVVATAPPTSYSNLNTVIGGGANGVSTQIATRNLAATQTENPGTFTSATEQWVSWTLAVYTNATQTGATGVATETDAAFALGAAVPVGLAIGTNTARALGVARPIGLAAETDTGLALAPVAIRAAGLATETETALPLGVARPLGIATETDSALALAPVQARAAGLASESDLALTPGGVPPGIALETDSALALGMRMGAAKATETDTALALAVARPVGLAAETDAAQTLGKAMVRAVGLATETETALALTRGQGAGIAAETDAALALSRVMTRSVGLASETEAALALSKVMVRSVGISTTTELALALGMGSQPAVATETNTAFALHVVVSSAVGLATETDTARRLWPPLFTPSGRRASPPVSRRSGRVAQPPVSRLSGRTAQA